MLEQWAGDRFLDKVGTTGDGCPLKFPVIMHVAEERRELKMRAMFSESFFFTG